MLTVAVPKRNKLPNIIVLTPKDGKIPIKRISSCMKKELRLALILIIQKMTNMIWGICG